MTTSLKVYADAALSSVVYNPNILQKSDGSTGPVDIVLYLGSVLAGKIIEAQSDPGVDNIVLSISDSGAGTGQTANAIKLALSSSGLDSAVAGASLSLGTEILSGADNAVAVYMRVQATDLSVGSFNELVLETNDLVETDA
jgi:hypothetical protein